MFKKVKAKIMEYRSARVHFSVALLLSIGLLQMAGDVARLPLLKAVGTATGASPAPKVFSSVHGLETFSSRYFLDWTDASGAENSVEITPENYSRIRGPYNRRNTFGAALAYAPVLEGNPQTQPMFESVVRYAVCGDRPLLGELGVKGGDVKNPVRIRVVPRAGTSFGDRDFVYTEACR